MKPTELWKNFNPGFELDVAGTFLFNGIRAFHEMEILDIRSDIFDFLYNVAVRVERLQKIAIILTEHDDAIDQAEFEKSLITHSHQELDRRLRGHGHPALASIHNSFLSMLSTFYKTYRYDRYGTGSLYRAGDAKPLVVCSGVRYSFPTPKSLRNPQLSPFLTLAVIIIVGVSSSCLRECFRKYPRNLQKLSLIHI